MANRQQKPDQTLSGKSSSVGRFFSIFVATIKPMGLFAGGLYLFGFGLFGLNRFGVVDALIPYERAGCLILGLAFLSWFVVSLIQLWRTLRVY